MRKYVYADEAGNFDFSNGRGATRHFVLTTVSFDDHSVANQLDELRRELAWDRPDEALGFFHATEDKQTVRDAVFEVIRGYDFRVDATILEKRKALPKFHNDELAFYKLAWFYHMKFVAPKIVRPGDELFVVAASIGIKRKREAFRGAIQDALGQVSPTTDFRCAMWAAVSDMSLQVADYCAWAIQRKWERSDLRAYSIIEGKVESEYDLFGSRSQAFY